MKNILTDQYGRMTPFAVALLMVGITFLVIFIVFGFAYISEKSSCADDSEAMGVRAEWRFCGGCYLEFDGRFVPKDRYFYLMGIQ